MKLSLARLDSVLDQQRIAGANVTRIRGTDTAMALLSQEIAGRDGPQIEKVKDEETNKEITVYLGIPIGVDTRLTPGLYVVLDMERRVP